MPQPPLPGSSEVKACIGPHIGSADYEVSPELIQMFSQEFGPSVVDRASGGRYLDLGLCFVRAALVDAGAKSLLLKRLLTRRPLQLRGSSRTSETGKCGGMPAVAYGCKRLALSEKTFGV